MAVVHGLAWKYARREDFVSRTLRLNDRRSRLRILREAYRHTLLSSVTSVDTPPTPTQLVIRALVVAVGVLGYTYWDSEHNTVVKAPGIEIKKN